MKSIFLLMALLIPFFSWAQSTEGEIVYSVTVQLDIDLPDDMDENMKKMIPSSQTATKSLKFNQQESLYDDWEAGENEDLEVDHQEGDMEFKMVMKRPENIFYSDHQKGTYVNSQEFFGRHFLITGDSKKCDWKLTGEQKKIEGFVCQKATCQMEEEPLVAWFTPQIPVSAGPNGYGGLPGMILEMDINNGQRTFVPDKIDLRKLDKKEIKQPEKGKKVTQEEFNEIRDEKMKELDMEMGGSSGGGVKMIIRN